MTKKIADVKYVHAAANDCLPSAVPPPIYRAGDDVTVERTDGIRVVVKLSHIDTSTGKFEGTVVASDVPEFSPYDHVSFRCQAEKTCE